ncbi:MAG: hypothetical protein NTW19_19555 [Planctomycetota bacterium]|nr:hypothetical protein [Planctomycetota bacterium]
MSAAGIHVVKLGGSLLDPTGLPDLLQRFARWRGEALGSRALLVVGGGETADVVRAFDKAFGLDEEAAHWLAIRAMEFNAHLVASVVERCSLVPQSDGLEWAWGFGLLAIMDPFAWLEREESQGAAIPHRWSFTSDCVSAHVATRVGASRLTLLKSTLPPEPCDLAEAGRLGIVDADFAQLAAALPRVELVNLRSERFERCVLKRG